MHPWWIPGAQDFPLKEERNEMDNDHACISKCLTSILDLCMIVRVWIWDGFPVRLAVILYKTIFTADGLLSYMSSI